MKIRIIRVLILVVALFSTRVIFRHLDKDSSYIGCSIMEKNNEISSLGIKMALYTRCPSSIEFLDMRKGKGSGFYYSWIPNSRCIPQSEDEPRLLSYWVGDSCILLCENDSNGRICYRVLQRDKDSFYIKDITSSDAGDMVIEGMTSRNSSPIIYTDVTKVENIIDARNCCRDIIILIILLLIIEISEAIIFYKCKNRE